MAPSLVLVKAFQFSKLKKQHLVKMVGEGGGEIDILGGNRTCTYSSVPNRRACTFINFEEKIPPARPYLALHVYCFWEKNPPARLFFCVYKGICPARLLILRKKSPLHGLIWVCTFNVFLRIFPPARLFGPIRLFGTLEYS